MTGTDERQDRLSESFQTCLCDGAGRLYLLAFGLGPITPQAPRYLEVPRTSFKQSRDWFGFFYDDVFCPPKFYHLVVEWSLGRPGL